MSPAALLDDEHVIGQPQNHSRFLAHSIVELADSKGVLVDGWNADWRVWRRGARAHSHFLLSDSNFDNTSLN